MFNSKLLRRSLKFYLTILSFVVLVVLGLYLSYRYFESNYSKEDEAGGSNALQDEYLGQQKQFEEAQAEVQKSINEYAGQVESELQTSVENVANLEDLKKLDSEAQGSVGVYKVNLLIDDGNVAEAQNYIDLLMLRNDGYGLEASIICYQQAGSQDRKSICVARANELARLQGIIDASDQLPDDYFGDSEGQQ